MFRKSLVGVFVAALAAYVLLANVLSLDLVTLARPGYHTIAHRLGEAMIVWTILWLLSGWYLYFFGGGRGARIRAMSVAIVPLAIGVALSAYSLCWYQRNIPGPHDGTLAWAWLASGLVETAKGILAALTLKLHDDVWRKYPWRTARSERDQRPERE